MGVGIAILVTVIAFGPSDPLDCEQCGQSRGGFPFANNMMRTTFLCCNGDDMRLFLASFSFLASRAVGGAAHPTANKMIRTTFPYCKHGDDMMLPLYPPHLGAQDVENGLAILLHTETHVLHIAFSSVDIIIIHFQHPGTIFGF